MFLLYFHFAGGNQSLSGLGEPDYPSVSTASVAGASSLRQLSSVKKVPLPAELVEQFGHMQCNCDMGLFTKVKMSAFS